MAAVTRKRQRSGPCAAHRLVALLALGVAACTTDLFDGGTPADGQDVMILSDVDSLQQVAGRFTLATASLVQRLEWWGASRADEIVVVPTGPDFAVRIFAITSDLPDRAPIYEVEVGAVAGTPDHGEHLRYTAPLPHLLLPRGEHLLSIVDRNQNEQWFWSTSCSDDCDAETFSRASDQAPWEPQELRMAFRLIGANDTEVLICHCEPRNAAQCQTLAVGIGAGFSHIDGHASDSFGTCEQ